MSGVKPRPLDPNDHASDALTIALACHVITAKNKCLFTWCITRLKGADMPTWEIRFFSGAQEQIWPAGLIKPLMTHTAGMGNITTG